MKRFVYAIVSVLVVMMAMVALLPFFAAVLVPLAPAMSAVGGTATLAPSLLSLWPVLIVAALVIGLIAITRYQPQQRSYY
jgi:type II secretory pathway component PulF